MQNCSAANSAHGNNQSDTIRRPKAEQIILPSPRIELPEIITEICGPSIQHDGQ